MTPLDISATRIRDTLSTARQRALFAARRRSRLYSEHQLYIHLWNIEAKIKQVVAALEDIKAQDIAVLDMSKLTSLIDCMIIASGIPTAKPGHWPTMCG